MRVKSKEKKIMIITIGIVIVSIVFVYFWRQRRGLDYSDQPENTSVAQQSGQIFLYGEKHAIKSILEKELALWSEYYHQNGIRDLFVELPYYTAEFMNLWMQMDCDDILDSLYQDWIGTALYTQEVMDFYKQLKKECPETVFHGTDVGHQYHTTGKRFLEYLESNGQEESKLYQLAQENIEQGQYYYQYSDTIYRENTMVENFIREMDGLNGVDIMGIYGSAHIGIEALDYETNTIPCMANQLYKKYGEALHTEDLTLSILNTEPYRVDTMTVKEKAYTAFYFGKVDLSAIFPDYQYREFWRLENAYDDFKNCPTVGNVLPYSNYPMEIEIGQVFVVEYTKADGSVIREYHRSDGNTWNGSLVTEEVSVEE